MSDKKRGFTLIELPVERKRGFTLIELLIVIAIIGILATIIIVAYTNAQAKARDNKRRADVQAIASAFQLYYLDNKKWYIPGTGWQGGGWGWFNADSGSYSKSIAFGLEEGKYLDSAPRDPKMKFNDDQRADSGLCVSQNSCYHYMVYPCDGGARIFARLEYPTSTEVTDAQNSKPTCLYPGYAQNYSVIVK